jgi:hypothetical protein
MSTNDGLVSEAARFSASAVRSYAGLSGFILSIPLSLFKRQSISKEHGQDYCAMPPPPSIAIYLVYEQSAALMH